MACYKKQKIKSFIESVFFLSIKKEYRFMGIKNFILYFIFQRIFRINSHVDWPVHWSSVVSSPQHIYFSGEVNPLGYSPGSYIQASSGIRIGRNVIHAAGIKMITENHDLFEFSKHIKSNPIEIGDNCWIGANAIILPGVVLGNHTIVAAGAVVTKSYVEGNVIIAGNPARVIKKIEPYSGLNYFTGEQVG